MISKIEHGQIFTIRKEYHSFAGCKEITPTFIGVEYIQLSEIRNSLGYRTTAMTIKEAIEWVNKHCENN